MTRIEAKASNVSNITVASARNVYLYVLKSDCLAVFTMFNENKKSWSCSMTTKHFLINVYWEKNIFVCQQHSNNHVSYRRFRPLRRTLVLERNKPTSNHIKTLHDWQDCQIEMWNIPINHKSFLFPLKMFFSCANKSIKCKKFLFSETSTFVNEKLSSSLPSRSKIWNFSFSYNFCSYSLSQGQVQL